MSGFTLVDVGKLAKPATVLVEKICNAVGVLYEPTGIRRRASAEADANRIAAMAQLDISDLQQRALQRLVHQEERKQANIESIANQAIEALSAGANPEKLDEDWVAHFFKQCDTVSDKEMQSLWAKLLGGEATSPGSYSRRTVDTVASFDKKDAELFTNFAQFVWRMNPANPLIYNLTDPIYKAQGITFDALSHLEAIGLVKYEPLSTYQTKWSGEQLFVLYHDEVLLLAFNAGREPSVTIGHCILTAVGRELVTVCGAKKNLEFFEYAKQQLVNQGVLVSSPVRHRSQP